MSAPNKIDLSKMKAVELRKELKSRGLPCTGNNTELVARLKAAMSPVIESSDIDLDYEDEIDSDAVLEEDDKGPSDILDDPAADTINEDLALDDPILPTAPAVPQKDVVIPQKTLKRKLTTSKDNETKAAENAGHKKIVLNRAVSVPKTLSSSEATEDKTVVTSLPSESNKIKITADLYPKSKLELRAKRFGIPLKMTDVERKAARIERFNQNSNSSLKTSGKVSAAALTEDLEKLKKRADRFGQSVSAIMTDVENEEKLKKRLAKFGTAK